MMTLILLAMFIPGIALAGDGEPSSTALIGYAIAAATSITPLAIILISLGKRTGRYETTQEQHAAELVRLQKQHEEAECFRRGDMAQMLTEMRLLREAHTAAMDRFSEKTASQLDKMLPKEVAVIQMGALESNVKSVAVERAVRDVITPLITALQPLIAAATRATNPPNHAG